jgi:hypothetical protein
MFTREHARATLKAKGYSYRAAAPILGVSYQHICLVLTGKRESSRLIGRIVKLKPHQTLKGRRNER